MHTPAPRALASCTTSMIYPGTTEHVCAVRADLRALLRECPMADDMVLCASELAANAVLHSHSHLPDGTFTVRVMIKPSQHARIEIEDNGGCWRPTTSDATQHHGLDIIRTLASDWGIDGDCSSRTIWAKFDWPERA